MWVFNERRGLFLNMDQYQFLYIEAESTSKNRFSIVACGELGLRTKLLTTSESAATKALYDIYDAMERGLDVINLTPAGKYVPPAESPTEHED
ncbi:MAG: hypothetical protein LUC17_05225 [Oscillospiraceae bacterium]|nr:hypothetical protein [Oscillospiraceae bacterium]